MLRSPTSYIGTAGWTIPTRLKHLFLAPGSHLERYAALFNAVEVNSSFYRSHRPATWARWAATVPPSFRFAVKAPKSITHQARLERAGALLQTFFSEIAPLGASLGPTLIQLPPKLSFDEATAYDFFTTLRELHAGAVALEPRHPSWFTPDVAALLRSFAVARVAADPPAGGPAAAYPAGWPDLVYRRLHGSPRTYYSAYSPEFLASLAGTFEAQPPAESWCIFDNTAQGEATSNALDLARILNDSPADLPRVDDRTVS